MQDAPSASNSSAAPMRACRLRAAQALAGTPGRATLEWHDLALLPAWALAEPADLAGLAWAAGAWLHADQLRRCIDGRVLALLHTRLREGFGALMNPQSTAGWPAHGLPLLEPASLQPTQLDIELPLAGRECLLATIESAALRGCLRERWSPGTPAPSTAAPRRAAARAIVDTVLAHHPSLHFAEAAR